MTVYIKATNTISPQETFPGKGIPETVREYNPYLKCILPDFKQYFPPLQLRRMNTLIKAGNACAIEVLKEAGIEKPDCIITATGLGCVEDTEKFLHQMLQTNEGLLAPTAFIQSTHNTIGAQVALNVNCKGYNVLYAHKSSSFENALLDSLLLIKEGEAKNILVGGFDELTNENYGLKKNSGIYKADTSNFEIPNSKSTGSIAGEGTSFFLITNKDSSANYAVIESVNILSYCDSIEKIIQWHSKILSINQLLPENIDLIICGLNGDINNNQIYFDVLKSVYKDSTQAYYKHLCGEYDTASAFGLWFAANVIKDNKLPKHAIIKGNEKNINNVVLYNQDNLKNHCLILLRKA
jgi:3-oxoacyl-[acyl-carrier-protein] synthase II